MNIGFLCHYSCGGSVRVAVELSAALAGCGHNAHLFSYGSPFCISQVNNGVVFHQIGTKIKKKLAPSELYTDWTPDELKASVKVLINSIRMHQIDIIHFHYAIPFAYMAMEIKRSMGKASPFLIGTLHGTDVTQCRGNLEKKDKLARALGYTDALTTVSDSHAKLSYDILGLSKAPEVIPNFVNLLRFQPVDKKKKSKPVIAHVSNFRPVKNTPNLAHIFLEIRKSIDAELWLIGDGPQMKDVKAVLHNGSGRDVKYWGTKQDVGSLLNLADLLLINSQYESFCLAALEAMACGVPVLAAKVGGVPEVVLHGETGFLFQQGNIKEAAALAKRFLAVPSLHGTMRKAARKQAQKFDINRILPLYENLYFQIENN